MLAETSYSLLGVAPRSLEDAPQKPTLEGPLALPRAAKEGFKMREKLPEVLLVQRLGRFKASAANSAMASPGTNTPILTTRALTGTRPES